MVFKKDPLEEQVLIRIVDDDEALREAISFDLGCMGWRTKTYASAREFLIDDDRYEPGCLVLDIRMPEMSGIELQKEMLARGYNLPIVILTGHGNLETSIQVFKFGAFDFLQKPVNIEEFVETITKACELSLLKKQGQLTDQECYSEWCSMSDREKEIIESLKKGRENRDIANALGLSIRTIQGHRSHIYQKLRVHSLEELLRALERVTRYAQQFVETKTQ